MPVGKKPWNNEAVKKSVNAECACATLTVLQHWYFQYDFSHVIYIALKGRNMGKMLAEKDVMILVSLPPHIRENM